MLEKLSEILETDISDLLYPHKVKQKKSGLGRSFEQISPKFILWSVIFYFILLVWGGMLIGCPLFGKIVGGGIEEEFLYIIYWGLILLVGYIAFCVCLLSENMARFLNEEAVDDKKAEDKTEDQDWDDKACQN